MSYYVDIDLNRISDDMIVETDDFVDVTEFFSLEEQRDAIKDILRFLNYKDKDIIYLSFLSKKRQVDIAEILLRTQPAVCYNIKRIKMQIEFVHFFLSKIDYLLSFLKDPNNGLTAHECDILLVLFYCSSVTKASSVIGFHQITCRNRLTKIFNKLEKSHPEIIDLFDFIMLKFNKIKRVSFKNKNNSVSKIDIDNIEKIDKEFFDE